MQFPKPRMKIRELIPLGFTYSELNQYAHMRGCPAVKNGKGKTSHWIFDTAEFDKWLKEKDVHPE